MATSLGGRLPLKSVARLSPQAKALHERLIGGRLADAPFRSSTEDGELLGPFNAYLYSPEIGAAFLALHEAEERATPLSKRMREIVILTVGAVWGADYELYAHRAVAMKIGFSPDEVAALASGRQGERLTENETVVRRFVWELGDGRRVTDATFDAAKRVLGLEGLIAATFLAGAYGLTCTLLNAFDVPAPAD